ncbi:MAG: hypothetical protein HYX68_15780 [Planctomycetes bacterium]|nr:hypothetical protein [Planctomycetota bacterium]
MPNAAPMINSAMLDSFSPKTNDILTVNVSVSDADSDPIPFDYVWKVRKREKVSDTGSRPLSFLSPLSLLERGRG